MDLAIETFNQLNKLSTNIRCLHFATDHLKKAKETDKVVRLVYTITEKNIVTKKEEILQETSHILC